MMHTSEEARRIADNEAKERFEFSIKLTDSLDSGFLSQADFRKTLPIHITTTPWQSAPWLTLLLVLVKNSVNQKSC